MLAAEQPDLVVFGGDQVTGWRWGLSGREPGWTEALWRNLTAPVVEAGIPYAMALGEPGHAQQGSQGAASCAVPYCGCSCCVVLLWCPLEAPPAAIA